ncbi:MAG: protein phosphatase [Glaciihabitans sp.]|nr:protein phosphatase [Glaciihabitans sp.]
MSFAAAESKKNAIQRMRLAALDRLSLIDTPAEERFDRITRIAREVFNVPVAEINLIDDMRQFTKSPQSVDASPNSDLDNSFCIVTIETPNLLVVPDATMDERFATRTTVTGERHIRFYAGRPLSMGDDVRVGTLCLVDTVPREMNEVEQQLLDEMGLWVERELRDTVSAAEARAAQGSADSVPIDHGDAVFSNSAGAARTADLDTQPVFEVVGASLPLRKFGTDFFTWHRTDNFIELTVADVMGKGAAAAEVAANIRAAFDAPHEDGDVASTLREVNAEMSHGLRLTSTFATLLHARIDLDSGVVDYVDAGHGLTLIVRSDQGVERLDSTGFPLGLMPRGTWEERSTILQPGDILVSFTDGLLNLFDGTIDSFDRVVELVRASSTPQEVIDRVVGLNRRGRARDDLTIVAISCTA